MLLQLHSLWINYSEVLECGNSQDQESATETYSAHLLWSNLSRRVPRAPLPMIIHCASARKQGSPLSTTARFSNCFRYCCCSVQVRYWVILVSTVTSLTASANRLAMSAVGKYCSYLAVKSRRGVYYAHTICIVSRKIYVSCCFFFISCR